MTSPYSFLQLMSHIYGIVPYYLEPGEAFPLPTIGLIYPLVPYHFVVRLLRSPSLYIDPPLPSACFALYIYTVPLLRTLYYLGSFFGWLAKRSLARKFHPL